MNNYSFLIIAVFTAISFLNAQEIKVIDREFLEKSPSMKVIEFDTLDGFTNRENKLPQLLYKHYLLHTFEYNINRETNMEILRGESQSPQLLLKFKIQDLYIKQEEKNGNIRDGIFSTAKISLEGFNANNNNLIFRIINTRSSVKKDLNDELLDNMLEIIDDFADILDSFAVTKRVKKFQYYNNMECYPNNTLQYLFLGNKGTREERVMYNIIDFDLKEESRINKYNLRKVSTSEINFLLQREKLDFNKIDHLISEKLQKNLLSKNVGSLLIFHNLRYLVPVEGPLKFDYHPFGNGILITSLELPDKADNVICSMYLLDVKSNQCKMKTQLYGVDPDDIGSEALDAIGLMDPATCEIKRCFN